MAVNQSTGIDSDALFGRYEKQEDWRNDLHKRLTHKALNIPLKNDGVSVTNTTTNSGIGAKGLFGIAAAAGLLPTAAIAAILGLKSPGVVPPAPTAPAATIAASTGASGSMPDSAYDVFFYDRNGNRIDVPRATKEVLEKAAAKK